MLSILASAFCGVPDKKLNLRRPFCLEAPDDQEKLALAFCLRQTKRRFHNLNNSGLEKEGMANTESFVDANTVAQFLAITRRQVLELARAKKIPAHPLLGGRRKVWRSKLSEVDATLCS
jgi:predicted DNA-binding transcriptional regulator AlpA